MLTAEPETGQDFSHSYLSSSSGVKPSDWDKVRTPTSPSVFSFFPAMNPQPHAADRSQLS
jgi:hypothetical protein